MNFGYSINQPRSINLDKNDLSYSRQLLREHPELETLSQHWRWLRQLHGHLYGRKPHIVQPT